MTDVQLSQGMVTVNEEGDGPTLFFMHGFLADSRLWDPVVDRLRASHRCVRPDLPLGSHRHPMRAGTDFTPGGVADLVAELLDALDLPDDVVVVGNDSGGALAQVLAARHRERIGGLVLTNCDMYDNFLPPAFRPLQWLARVPGGLEAVIGLTRFRLARRIGYGPLVRGADDALLRSWVEPCLTRRDVRRDARQFALGIHSRWTNDAAATLARDDLPIRLAWGTGDRFFTVSTAERFEREVPSARLTRIPGARTFVPLERPDEVARLIAQLAQDGATTRTAPGSARTVTGSSPIGSPSA